MSQPAVSAIVASYQTGPRLKECLYALLGDPEVNEIILVDNGNPQAMQAWMADFAQTRSTVTLISGHGNIGFGAAINRGISRAAGPHLLVINPDAVLRRNSVSGMQAAAADCADPWIVGGKIFDLYGREERGPRRRELTLWRAATRPLGWNTWTLESTPPPSGPVEMPAISGAFFLTSAASMAQLEGFDEGYFLHVEDVDLCRRCRAAGGQVIYDPRSGALHYGATSDSPSAVVERHKADGLARYFKKFAEGPFERLAVAILVPMMRAAMALKHR